MLFKQNIKFISNLTILLLFYTHDHDFHLHIVDLSITNNQKCHLQTPISTKLCLFYYLFFRIHTPARKRQNVTKILCP